MHAAPTGPAEKLVQAVRIKTVSYSDKERIDHGELEKFQQFIQDAFPALYEACTVTLLDNVGLLMMWEGRRKDEKAVGFVAHYDVVPVEDDSLWDHPPFEGIVEDGYVWGRGALDLKGFLIALLEAGNQLAIDRFMPVRTIYFLLGGDEEINGLQGAGRMSSFLEKNGVRFECIYDEGSAVTSGMLPGIARPAAVVGIAEKGQVTISLKAVGADGHSARPPKETAIGTLSRAISIIESNPFPLRLTPAIFQFLKLQSPYQSGINRFLLTNLKLFKALIIRQLAKNSDIAALLRTTQAPTVIRGGDADNALPLSAEALINCRLLPGDKVESVIERYRKLLDGLEVEVSVAAGSFSSEAVPSSNTESIGYRNLSDALLSVYPDAVVLPYVVTVATDSKHYAGIADNIFRIMPFLLDGDEVSRVHGINERLSITNLHNGTACFKQLLQAQ